MKKYSMVILGIILGIILSVIVFFILRQTSVLKCEPYSNSDYTKYSKTKTDMISYFENILSTWKKDEGSKLYRTYSSEDQNRIDIYDNALLANMLIMINTPSSPSWVLNQVKEILDFYKDQLDLCQRKQLIFDDITFTILPAAYERNTDREIVPKRDSDGLGQDFGNNSIVGIALGKFCTQYPFDEKTEGYKSSLEFLVQQLNGLRCAGNNGGFSRRYPLFYDNGEPHYENHGVSIEHMIDGYALGVICENIMIGGAVELKNSCRKYIIYPLHDFSSNAQPRIFLDETHYGIGGSCDREYEINNNIDQKEYGQPFDTQTWNMLSGVDPNKDRKTKSLLWTIDNGYNSSSDPGILFAYITKKDTGCSQYENTGSLLCAFNLYIREYGMTEFMNNFNDYMDKILSIFEFIHTKINTGVKIQAAYKQTSNTGYLQCDNPYNPQGCCSYVGSGWNYPLTSHLGSTVYCALALLSISNDCNIYQVSTMDSVVTYDSCNKSCLRDYSSGCVGDGSSDCNDNCKTQCNSNCM